MYGRLYTSTKEEFDYGYFIIGWFSCGSDHSCGDFRGWLPEDFRNPCIPFQKSYPIPAPTVQRMPFLPSHSVSPVFLAAPDPPLTMRVKRRRVYPTNVVICTADRRLRQWGFWICIRIWTSVPSSVNFHMRVCASKGQNPAPWDLALSLTLWKISPLHPPLSGCGIAAWSVSHEYHLWRWEWRGEEYIPRML